MLRCAAVQLSGRTKREKREQGKRARAAEKGPATTQFQIRNVNFRIHETVTLEIASLRGELLSNKPGKLPTFDDRESLLMKIDAGEGSRQRS